MEVTIFSLHLLSVKPGTGSNVDLTAQNRLDSGFMSCPVKINHPIHNAVIGNGRCIHAQFFHPGCKFFYLIGTVQKTVFRMNVKMCK